MATGQLGFSLRELQRIQADVLPHFQSCDGGNILGVGFGPKVRRDPRSGRDRVYGKTRLSVRLLVKEKRLPRIRRRRIDSSLTLRFRRERSRVSSEIALPTDVEEVGEFVPTGTALDNGRPATSSAVIRWLPSHRDPAIADNWNWGLLTVGHPYQGESRPVEVNVERLAGSEPKVFTGKIRIATDAPDDHDAAIIDCDFWGLRLSGFIPDPNRLLPFRPGADLEVDTRQRARGRSLRKTQLGAVPFTLKTYLPKMALEPLGTLVHVLEVEGEHRAFRPGTSGAIWQIGTQAAAIQVGSFKPGFSKGVGQAMLAVMRWVRQQLGTSKVFVVHVF